MKLFQAIGLLRTAFNSVSMGSRAWVNCSMSRSPVAASVSPPILAQTDPTPKQSWCEASRNSKEIWHDRAKKQRVAVPKASLKF
jgi:hypothetical protein